MSEKRHPSVAEVTSAFCGRHLETVIGECPKDGREWEPCCGRCGSSVDRELCYDCDGDGFVEDELMEDDADADFETCPDCGGTGGWWRCMSSPEWCAENPLLDRENIGRGEIEWFTT